VLLHPGFAEPLVTVSVYTDVTVGVAVGLAIVVEERNGPAHVYVLVLPPAPALNATLPPSQIGPLFDGEAVGCAATVTEVVYTVEGLHPGPELATVKEYMRLTVGVAPVVPDVGDTMFEPLQTYIYDPTPPVALAERLTTPLAQIGPLFVGAAVGTDPTIVDVV